MATYYAALVHGSKTFLLDGSRDVYLEQSYSPPGINQTTVMSSGNMRNRAAGGRVTARKLNDRIEDLPLQVKGTTAAETHGAVRTLESFIYNALNDQSEKLFFVYSPVTAVPYTPKWGQNFKKYEIKNSDGAYLTRGIYGTAEIRSTFVAWSLPLTLAPTAVGERQRVGSATGGILEHTFATPDGISRGLIIPQAAVTYGNKVLNPVFGNGTWNTGWAESGGLIDTENTDKDFILFGSSSAKLTDTDGSGNYTTSVTCAAIAFTFSFFCKLPDGGTVDDSVVVMSYDGNPVTEVYQNYGNGWWRVWATDTGVAGAADLVIAAKNYNTIHIDMVVAESGSYPTSPFYGDMLGCTWDSTAHNSVSTRVRSNLVIPTGDCLDIAEGSIRIAMIVNYDSDVASNISVFDTQTSRFRLSYLAAGNTWQFTDNVNSATSSAQSFDYGDIIILHLVWSGTGGLALYVNGSADGSAATYTPATHGAGLYLGSSVTPDSHGECTFLDFTTFDRAATAAEILADYTDITAHVSGGDGLGQRLNPIPWLWSDDGDDITDNCLDSTHENYIVCGGIPGNMNARTVYELETEVASENIGLSLQNYLYNYSMTDVIATFADQSGTATGASDCGGEVAVVSVTGTGGIKVIGLAAGTSKTLINNDIGFTKDFYVVVRVKDAGSDLRASLGVIAPSGTGTLYTSDWQDIDPASASFGLYKIGPINVSTENKELDIIYDGLTVAVRFMRKTGASTNDITVDWACAAPEPFLYVDQTEGILDGNTFYNVDISTRVWGTSDQATGDFNLDLYPNYMNVIFNFLDFNDDTNLISGTLTYHAVYVTPKWSLL